jgi:hypothetical protein
MQGSGGSTYYFMCSFVVTCSYVCKEIVIVYHLMENYYSLMI